MNPSASGSAAGASFADALIQRVRKLAHPLCLGLDPHLAQIPPVFRTGSMRAADPATADSVERFSLAVIERAAERVAVLKPQIALFEQLGWRGIRALERAVARARALGMLVILDAKRADIASSAEGYAAAYLQPDSPLPVDAITTHPYLGSDALEPFVRCAREHGRGLFVLVATSNPGGRELQNQLLADGTRVAERVAQQLAPTCESLVGPETGWSALGVVIGATRPEHSDAIRRHLPRALLLVPGFGTQGGAARDAVRGFVPGPSGLEGGVVNASRSVLFGERPESELAEWERQFDARVARHAELLGQAVRS